MPGNGSRFSGWTGDIQNDFPEIEYRVIDDLNITAGFIRDQYHLSTETVGKGTITVSPDTEDFSYNETVFVEPTPDPGYYFSHWSGDVQTDKKQLVLSMRSNQNIVGVFKKYPEYTIEGSWISINPDDEMQYVESDQQSHTELLIEIYPEMLAESKKVITSDRIIIKYRNKHNILTRDVLEEFGSQIKRIDYSDRVYSIIKVFSTEQENINTILRKLNSIPEIEFAEPDYIYNASAIPNDEFFSYQWNMSQLNIPAVWDITMGNASTIAAVIDTGVREDLEDMVNTSFVSGFNFVANNTDTRDDNAHGTHVAGTIAQTTNNNYGCAGIAPNVSIMPIKVLDSNGSGYNSDIAAGIAWAVDNGADVINLSLGGPAQSQTMLEAIEYAYNSGVAIFAATGNDSGTVLYPAAYDNFVLAVGATRYDKTRAYYSNYGEEVDIVAPGGDLYVDQNVDGYGDGILQQTFSGEQVGFYFYQGTSMATPHVTALGSLIKSIDNLSTAEEIYSLITNNAEDLGVSGRDNYFGYGLINPLATIEAVSPNPTYEVFDEKSMSFYQACTHTWQIQAANGPVIVCLQTDAGTDHSITLKLLDNNNEMVANSNRNDSSQGVELVYNVMSSNEGIYSIVVEVDYK